MPMYHYAAIDPNTNRVQEGRLEAINLRAAKEMIRTQGHIPTMIEEDHDLVTVESMLCQIPVLGPLFAPKAGLKDICIFTQQLYTLLDAGIPLIEGLFLLEQQTTNKRLQDIIRKVRLDVIAGDSYSQALSRFPREFSTLYLNMIRAGEISGEMDRICNRLGTLMDKEMNFRAKIKGALVMPAITFVIIVAVIILILILVVPQFQNLFSSYHKALPLPTQVLMASSSFLQHFWWALLIGLTTFGVWFNNFRRKQGKGLIDQWLLTLPIFGGLLNKMYVSSFIRTLSTLVESGVSLIEGISTASATVDNDVMRLSLDKAKESIYAGGSLSKPLEQSGLFPKLVVKMMAIGEETGKLNIMLDKAANFLDQEVEFAVTNLTKLIEPMMVVILGSVLLVVALSLYMPMWEMSSAIAKGG